MKKGFLFLAPNIKIMRKEFLMAYTISFVVACIIIYISMPSLLLLYINHLSIGFSLKYPQAKIALYDTI
jgi:hypothetical protein